MTLQDQRIARIVSGGQAGADRGALDAAVDAGVEYGGWCPADGWAEDFPDPPGLLTPYPHLRPTESADPGVRTSFNVRDSHATLIVRTPGTHSPGTDLTVQVAADLRRPCLVTAGDLEEALGWLATLGGALTLNVAGPRESEQPGVYDTTRQLVSRLLARPASR